MKKRTRVLTVMLACLLCVALAGGAAYAMAPSFNEAGAEAAAEQATAQQQTQEETFADAYADEAQHLQLSGYDSQGNHIAQPSTIPSLITAQAESNAHTQTQVPLQTVNHQEAAQSANAQKMPSMSLQILGAVIPYIDSYDSPSAPDNSAGLWRGSDSTQDGTWGYFIGHHPGVFNCVMYLEQGDTVTVCDRNGNARTYTVTEIYDVPNTTQWGQIASDVTSHGESITIQTCCGDGESYRIVEAV